MSETRIGGDREGRAGQNQSLFREVNERVLETNGVAGIEI